MSGNGNCFDNAPVESFFKTLKSKMVWRTVFQSRRQATTMIGRWIDGYHNPIRNYSTLHYISPIAFEREAA